MTAHSKPYPRVEFLIQTFADWLKHRRELNEIRQMDRGDFDRIASDLEVAPGELHELVRRGPHAGDELHKLLQELGIDEAKLANTQPLVLRDMQRVCALCRHKARCDHDLIAGNSAMHHVGYCPNAPTIGQLEAAAKAAAAH